MPRTIDLNCDLGEGCAHDAELMPLITSANIACGAHAGDVETMRATVALAKKHGVTIGAHPGFADRENFGRRELKLSPDEIGALVRSQLVEFAKVTEPRHVKLHGALYTMAARDEQMAALIVGLLAERPSPPMLIAPAGSVLERVAREHGMFPVAAEVFADRTYQRDGSLTPRSRSDALITDESLAVAQVLRIVRDGVVRTTDGTDIPMRADTVCVHGDGPQAVAFARRLNHELRAAGITLKPA